MPRRRDDDLPVEWMYPSPPEQVAPPGKTARIGRHWYLLALAIGVLAVGVASLRSGHHAHRATSPVTVAPLPPDQPVRTTKLGRPLLAVPAGWELFARGSELIRIQLRAGLITRTAVPALGSTGPIFLVVGRSGAIIRPLDLVPGYGVADGRPARPLTGLLGHYGPAFPGPDSNHLWIASDSGSGTRMELVGFDGADAGVSIPAADGFSVISDGTGGVVVSKSTGIYLTGAGGLSLVTTGRLLAVGPSRWLTVECQLNHCNQVVIDRSSGARRVIGAAPPSANAGNAFPLGLVSPDGTTAALIDDTGVAPQLRLMDLITGHSYPIPVQLPTIDASEGVMAWSPDSHWLFFVDSAGQIRLVDRQAAHLGRLDIQLPAVDQIAMRVTSN